MSFIQEIASVKRKLESGEEVSKADLVPLVLCPLMGGKMSQKDRIAAVFQITGQATMVSSEETQKIESMVYAMAEKFLDNMDLEDLKEGMKMTRLGEMLVNDGIERGMLEAFKEAGISIDEAVDKVAVKINKSREEVWQLAKKLWEV